MHTPDGSPATDVAVAGRPAPAEGAAPVTGPGWLPRVAEVVLLLAAPVIAFFGLRVEAMAPNGMIDPAFYTAYAQHGRDLIERYGAAFYYSVRDGFLLPAHVAYLLFGAVPGFYVLRYVFALVAVGPAYLLFRRLRGRWAGAVAVATILACPPILHAWGTDYPDSASVSYLAAGTACLFMPATTPLRRLGWVAGAGVALSLALHSQVTCAPLVAALLLAYVVVFVRESPRRMVVHLATMAGCLLVVTAGLVLFSKAVFGFWNIWRPTWHAITFFSQPKEIRIWHSSNWHWVNYFPFLLVPLAALLSWGVVRLGRRAELTRAETGIVLAAALEFAAYTWWQFFHGGDGLEYYLYSSQVWPVACLLAALVITALCAPLLRTGPGRWLAAVPALLVLAVPRVMSDWRADLPQFTVAWTGLVVLAAVVLAAGLGRVALRWRGGPVAALACTVAVLAGAYTLTVAKPVHAPYLVGQSPYPIVDYRSVIGGDGSRLVDMYRVQSGLHTLVPAARHPGDRLLMWYSRADAALTSFPAAQYLWHLNSLSERLPRLTPHDLSMLETRQPGELLLLGASAQQFPAAVAALAAANAQPQVVRRAVLSAGPVHLAVWVLYLQTYR